MSARPVAIRPATPADAPAVAQLMEQLGYPASDGAVAARLAALAADPAARVILACTPDGDSSLEAVRGLATVHTFGLIAEGTTIARITALVVHVDDRRTGVGRALVAAAEDHARAAGCTSIEVASGRRPERDAAHRFYPTLGYEETCSHHAHYRRQLVQGSSPTTAPTPPGTPSRR